MIGGARTGVRGGGGGCGGGEAVFLDTGAGKGGYLSRIDL